MLNARALSPSPLKTIPPQWYLGRCLELLWKKVWYTFHVKVEASGDNVCFPTMWAAPPAKLWCTCGMLRRELLLLLASELLGGACYCTVTWSSLTDVEGTGEKTPNTNLGRRKVKDLEMEKRGQGEIKKEDMEKKKVTEGSLREKRAIWGF